MNSEYYAVQYLDMLIRSRKQIAESLIQKPINGEEYVIEYLAAHPGPVYPSDLSEKMQASSARVAAILRHLESISVISRETDVQDARKRPVELNGSGLKRAQEIREKRIRLVSDVFNTIGEEETRAFLRITDHIIQVCREKGGLGEGISDKKEGSA